MIGSKDLGGGQGGGMAGQAARDDPHAQCATVMEDIAPICAPWGVKIIKYDLSPDRCSRSGAHLFWLFVCRFQLESTRLADVRFAADYERRRWRLPRPRRRSSPTPRRISC